MSVVECPGCGAVYENVRLQKTASEFCAGCDYPLFWATRRDQGLDDEDRRGDGPLQPTLRRRPGAAGLQVPAGRPCPACRELNPPAAASCLRCGAAMDPAPPPAPVPRAPAPLPPPPAPTLPPPAPAPPRRSVAPIVIAVLTVVVAVQLLVLLVR